MDLEARAPAAFHELSDDEQDRFRAHADRLLRHASWEAASGFELTDEMVLTVAAHAALVVAGFEPDAEPYRNVTAIVVHGRTIVTRGPQPGPIDGVMTSSPRRLAGQSGHGRGPVLLDWATLQREIRFPERGTNVVYHEFAHKLDQLDGFADGVPPLGDRAAAAAWEQTIGTNFRRLQRRGSDPVVRAYGATNRAEYFAVTSELLFTRPHALREHLPRVYRALAGFYHQDPAARVAH